MTNKIPEDNSKVFRGFKVWFRLVFLEFFLSCSTLRQNHCGWDSQYTGVSVAGGDSPTYQVTYRQGLSYAHGIISSEVPAFPWKEEDLSEPT